MDPLHLTLLNFKLHKSGETILDRHSQNIIIPICCLVAKSCLDSCDPMDYSPSTLLCLWGFPGKKTGVVYQLFLQWIFPTQGSNLCLPHWQADSQLSCQGKKVEVKPLSRLRLTNCSLSGSSVHGIFQARVLEWIAISFSRGSSRPGIKPGSPVLQADALPSEPPGKPQLFLQCLPLTLTSFISILFT